MRRKTLLFTAALIALLLTTLQSAKANDAVYFASGSQLRPMQETDISVKKEVLTITIGEDGFAYVDVNYEFMNNGAEKTIVVGFESQPPYNSEAPLNKNGIHPHIKDFSVTMNNAPLKYRNAIMFIEDHMGNLPKDAKIYKDTMKMVPVDFSRWEDMEESTSMIRNRQTGEEASIAYVYYFDAKFKKGINTVRHTYRYEMSFGVGFAFGITYWLTPAMRWANHQIDDFTLRISSGQSTKHFSITCDALDKSPFRVVKGTGKTRLLKLSSYDQSDNMDRYTTEAVLRNGVLEWHATNFKTTEELDITSADELEYMTDLDRKEFMLYYDSGISFGRGGEWMRYYDDLYTGPDNEKKKREFTARLRRNLPYAHRGYVFKDPELKRIFESLWWYMPDPNWQPTNDSFSKHEQQLIANSNKFD